MSTTLSYINLASSMLATMVAGGINPLMSVICIIWLGLAAWQAYRDGILDDNN